MKSILTLTAKDLRRRLASPAGLILSLTIPLAMGGMMLLAFGRMTGTGQRDVPQLRLVVVDQDESPISGIITGATQNPEAAERMHIERAASREEGERLLRDQDFAALLIIPKGFGEALLGSQQVELELVKNPAQRIMPVAAQQITEVMALYLSGAARLLGEDGLKIKQLFEGEGWQDTPALTSLVTVMRDRITSVSDLLFPPLIEVGTGGSESDEGSPGGFNFISWMYPGMIVMGLMFTGLDQMKDLLREREAGTLRRQLAAPVSARHVLIGKVLSVALVAAIAQIILVVIGSLVFRVSWGDPLALAAASGLIVLAVTGFAALLYSLVRTERQGDAFGGILTMVMAMLGGAFVPLQVMPEWLKSVSQLTVNHWCNEALRSLTSGGGWSEMAPYLGVLAGMGVVSTAAGVLLLHRRHMRGAL